MVLPNRTSESGIDTRRDENSLYQIDFTALSCGKRIASTKRRIRWRFGFTNKDALNSGLTGTDCRGEEHDITLIWSLTSGKRFVIADSQEVHYSNGKSNLFEFSWTLRADHVLKIVAHSSFSITGKKDSCRQYDFFVNGLSFFNMPKTCRLGLIKKLPDHESRVLTFSTFSRYPRNERAESRISPDHPSTKIRPETITNIEAPLNIHEEEAYLEQAIRNSLLGMDELSSETVLDVSKVEAPQKDLLLDFLPEPDPAQISTTPDVNHDTPRNFVLPVPPTLMDIKTELSTGDESSIYKAHTTSADKIVLPVVDAASTHNCPAGPFTNLSCELSPSLFQKDCSLVPTSLPNSKVTSVQPPTACVPSPRRYMDTPVNMTPPLTCFGPDANTALYKFDNMNSFDLVSNNSNDRKNPFDNNNKKNTVFTCTDLESSVGSDLELKHSRSQSLGMAENHSLVMSNTQHGNWRVSTLDRHGIFSNHPSVGSNYGYQVQPQYGIYGSDISTSGQGTQRHRNQMEFIQPQQYFGSNQQPSHGY